jgi:hypothetical protein
VDENRVPRDEALQIVEHLAHSRPDEVETYPRRFQPTLFGVRYSDQLPLNVREERQIDRAGNMPDAEFSRCPYVDYGSRRRQRDKLVRLVDGRFDLAQCSSPVWWSQSRR